MAKDEMHRTEAIINLNPTAEDLVDAVNAKYVAEMRGKLNRGEIGAEAFARALKIFEFSDRENTFSPEN